MPSPDTPWDDRVRFATDSAGRYFAYRPNELIVHRSALSILRRIVGTDVGEVDDVGGEPPDLGPAPRPEPERALPPEEEWPDEDAEVQEEGDLQVEDVVGPLVRVTGVADPVYYARALRSRGFPAQVNHVAFAAA